MIDTISGTLMKLECYLSQRGHGSARSVLWSSRYSGLGRGRSGRPTPLLLFHFDGKGVRIAEHVRAEHDPLLIGREAHVRFELVLMLAHIDELFRMQHAGLHETL